MNTSTTNKKLLKDHKKKSGIDDFFTVWTDICDKEVLALTGGIYPLLLQKTKIDPGINFRL